MQKQFRLNAGKAAAFARGDIHSIAYGDDTFFIRVTGGDVEKHKTLRFNLDKQTVEVEDRTQRPREISARCDGVASLNVAVQGKTCSNVLLATGVGLSR